MAVASYKLEIDWANNGNFTGTGDSLDMGRVRSIQCSFGRDRASQLTGNAKAGTLRAVIDNRSGDYSYFNSSSPLYGNLLPGRPVRLLTSSASLTDQPVWRGFLTKITPTIKAGGDSTVTIEATGPLGYINLDQINVPMVTSQRTDQVVDDILDAAGWPAGGSYRPIDTGKTTITRYWKDSTYAVPALQEVQATEAGFVHESKDGKIDFEGRHFRLSGARLTSQATFSDADGAARVYQAINQDDPVPHIFNIFETEIITTTTASIATLWTLSESGANSPSIEPGLAATYIARYPTQASASNAVGVTVWTTVAATTDMTANTAADGSGTNLTSSIGISVSKSSETMSITLTNNATSTAYITLLKARGTGTLANDPVTIQESDATSKTAFGERTWPSKTKFIPTTAEAANWGKFNIAIYKDPTPMLKLTFVANRDQNSLNEMINRNISDRVTIVAANNANLAINSDFFIEGISHTISNNRLHLVTLLLSWAEQFSDWWVLGTSALGTTTRLAY